MPKKVIVTQDPEAPVETEVLAQAIVDIAKAAKVLLNGKLRRRALYLLIKDAAHNNVTITDIERVLDAAADLEKRYVNS